MSAAQPFQPERDPKPVIDAREDVAIVDEAERALLADPDAGLYVRAGELVRVVADTGDKRAGLLRPAGTPVIQRIPLDALRERIAHAANWARYDAKGKARPALPPEFVSRMLAARGTWRFPQLEAVVEAPTFTRDGEVLAAPGYDSRTGLLVIPACDFPPVPPRPSLNDVGAAIRLIEEPFSDFPFVDKVGDGDLAAAIAAALTLAARHAIAGCVPLFACRANTPGTGKGLCVDVCSTIGTGRAPARRALPDTEAEWQKSILAVALEGLSSVLIDNVDGVLKSAAFAGALTAPEFEGRILGQNVTARAPLRSTWFVTGNNVSFGGDLGRRVVLIDLNAPDEHPEDRTDFRHPELLSFVRERRPALLAAALTLLRAYHVAGRPTHGLSRKGSFEDWDDLVRGTCVWAEIGDPLAGTERIRGEDDADLASLRGLLTAWWEQFGNDPKTSIEVVNCALARAADPHRTDSALRDALLELTGREKLDSRSVGCALRMVRRRIAGGMSLETAGDTRDGSRRWQVRDMRTMRDMFTGHAGEKELNSTEL